MKSRKTNIIVKLQVDGIHCWPAAKEVFPEVSFLSDPHRHMFYITCKLGVNHDDRDREFIMFKRDILEYLGDKYYDKKSRTHQFGSHSCEMLARELMHNFNLKYCSVFEDDERYLQTLSADIDKSKTEVLR